MVQGAEWQDCRVLVSRQDQGLLDLPAPFDDRMVPYEWFVEQLSVEVPQRAVVFPIKVPWRKGCPNPVDESSRVLAAVRDRLKYWLKKGCHLLFILPGRSFETGGAPERSARQFTSYFLDGLVSGFAESWEATPFGDLRVLAPEARGRVPIADGWVGFRFHQGGEASATERVVSRAEAAATQAGHLEGAEVIARNEQEEPVAISLEVLAGRVSVVPRGILGGELEPLRWAFPKSIYVEMGRQARKQGDIGEVLVGGERIALEFEEYEMVETLLRNRLAQGLGRRQIDWPPTLEDRPRDKILKRLETALGKHGPNLLVAGAARKSPSLATAVIPPEFVQQGWEKPESLVRPCGLAEGVKEEQTGRGAPQAAGDEG